MKYILQLIILLMLNNVESFSAEKFSFRNAKIDASNFIGADSLTSLNKIISIDFVNENLLNIIKEIGKRLDINFIYDNSFVNVKGITIKAVDKQLYKILEEILEPYNISYYEYEFGNIALAKIKKVRDKTGGIEGIIKDEKGEEIIGANALVKELRIGSTSDTKGNYSIRNIKPGEYTIEVSFVGYEKLVHKIKITAGKLLQINLILKSTSFQIGGIEVVGTTELLPKDVSTKTNITSGEIEHFQASSIKDVLDLVPGVQKSDNPGLGKTSQISVRGDESNESSAFGTLIIVDGTPISNNANMQFEKLVGSKFGISDMGRGIDLRTIPADNIESIEIITGLPSVKYGDATSGIINVQTKIGPSPHRLKIKNNPDTREANLGGGIMLGGDGMSYNVNLARSERNIRVIGDEYTRVTGQVVYSANLFGNILNINNKMNFQAIYDEEEPKGDMLKTKNYNRGFTMGYSAWGKYKPEDGISTLDYNMFVTMRKENSMRSKLVQAGNHILPNGDTVAAYLGKVETKGIEWTVGGRLEYGQIFYTGDFIHKIIVGADPQYNANTGQGLVFDTVYSYYGPESGRRPYSFNSVPGQFLMNVYAEDKITGNIIFDFNLMLGVRYEMYRPYKFNISGIWGDGDLVKSHQGSFFNPRVNLMVYFSSDNQMRLSFGTTSKSPSMSLIYPPYDYMLWKNPLTGNINHYKYDLRSPELQGYREAQIEAAFDQKISNMVGISLSAYYKKRTGEPQAQTYPVFFAEKDSLNIPHISYIDSYGVSRNLGGTESKGIEFSLRTKKIKPLNMEFQIVGSYSFIKNMTNNYSFDYSPDTAKGQYSNYTVPTNIADTLIGYFYPSSRSWADRLQLNYNIKYTCPPLGLWLTLRAEQLLFERHRTLNLEPEDYNKLNSDEKAGYDFERLIMSKPNKWLLSLNISKSLFKGAEVSFYVNNFLDDNAIRKYETSPGIYSEEIRNPALTYGLEFSMIIDALFREDN